MTKNPTGKRAAAHTRKAAPAKKPRVNDAEPAHSIIQRCGGVRPLARGLGISAAAVTRWQTRRTDTDSNGCDGVIPEFRHKDIIAFAKTQRVRIKHADFQ